MREWSPFRAYGGKRPNAFCLADLASACLLLAGCAWFYFKARNLPAYSWNWDICLDFIYLRSRDGSPQPGLLIKGLFTTLRVGFWTFFLALVTGGIAGLAAARKSFWGTVPYFAVVNLLRNTPPIILLFCVYFMAGNLLPVTALEDTIREMPPIFQNCFTILFAQPGQLDRMISAVLALGLYQAAYVAEIFRSGLNSVPREQMEAGLALGFNKFATLWLIIFPQALRLAIPALTGQCLTAFKESSLASLISLPDLTFQSLEIMATSGMTFEVWISAGILYLLLGVICSFLGRILERRYSKFI